MCGQPAHLGSGFDGGEAYLSTRYKHRLRTGDGRPCAEEYHPRRIYIDTYTIRYASTGRGNNVGEAVNRRYGLLLPSYSARLYLRASAAYTSKQGGHCLCLVGSTGLAGG